MLMSNHSQSKKDAIHAGMVQGFSDMDDAQFQQWCDLLEQRTGMRLAQKRRSFLVTSLGMRMRALGYSNYQDYYEHIQSGRNGSVEWDQLIHHLTVHETRFFRHQGSLDLIRKHCLPQAANSGSKPLSINIWSVGCSSGEEPYSIAMTIDSHMRALQYENYMAILATDISRDALAKGRQGIYSKRQYDKLQHPWQKAYFSQVDDSHFQICDELRQRICFNQANILDLGKTPIGSMDVIICQNVLIYYERSKRLEIVNNLANYLAPGGMFIFAVGELLGWEHPDMERFQFPNTLAYRRKLK